MTGNGIESIQLLLLLLLVFVVVFSLLARKLQTPYPILLVIGGLALSLIPAVPTVPLDSNLIFFVVLPPLVYAAAWQTSWRDFSHNLVSILLLAFGLVAFTVFGVAATARWLFPSIDWRSGFLLGAVVAPTDVIAATAIARRLDLTRRIVDILEGESLVNDATGLLALEFGVAMLVSGRTLPVGEGLLRLGYLTIAGLAIGLAIGYVIAHLERRFDDAPIEITISLLLPYGAYFAAEAAGASGVLAVVACGLYMGWQSSEFFSPGVRIEANAVWNSLTFVLNGLVFVLLGLQLKEVLRAMPAYTISELLLYGAIFSLLVIALRLIWVFPGAYIAWFIRSHFLRQQEALTRPREAFVVGWAGMRGVIALAAALSLPTVIARGVPYPQRNLIIFLTFSAILVTLVLQGLTLPPIIRLLKLAGTGADDEEEEARRIMLRAALARLEDVRRRGAAGFEDVYDHVAEHYRTRLASISGEGRDEHGTSAEHHARYLDVSREMLGVERETAIRLRNERKISDETLRELQHELDLNETRLERL